ncbi:MAG: polyprenyl synthetase family protein [Planctomycetes bacterium]|nr:polyprenyl synthetase family protein [Planctomycetota bacterium]
MSAERAGGVEVWLAEARAWADRELDLHLPRAAEEPARLHEALRYAVFGGAKRLRPALVRLFATHFGARDADCALAAVAIECLHTYSLVHDDLPCMDDDDLRRGRPTCHKVYGEALAVLVGDALLTQAFGLLGRERTHASALVVCLAEAAGTRGMVGGQALDLSLAPHTISSNEVARVHAWKTAALIGAACEMGAIVAGAGATSEQRAREYGVQLGLCFQAVDDILDVTGDAATLGKTPGKDERAAKPTVVAVLGLAGARREARARAGAAEALALELGAQAGDLMHALPAGLLVRTA